MKGREERREELGINPSTKPDNVNKRCLVSILRSWLNYIFVFRTKTPLPIPRSTLHTHMNIGLSLINSSTADKLPNIMFITMKKKAPTLKRYNLTSEAWLEGENPTMSCIYHVIGVCCPANQHPESTIKKKRPQTFAHLVQFLQKMFACSRCVICVSCSVDYYVRKGSWAFYLNYLQINEVGKSDHVVISNITLPGGYSYI